MSTPYANLDFERLERCGHPEAVYAAGKTPEEVCAIAFDMVNHQGFALVTRMHETHGALVEKNCLDRLDILWSPRRQTALIGTPPPERKLAKPVRIVCAGTSDRLVGAEAALTLRALGIIAPTLVDVGVAGLHRLIEKLPELRQSSAIIAIAGMEGTLPGVIAGLVACPVIAVPASIGYGVSANGQVALNTMLASCAAGLTVVNIDNGFGAACAVGRMILK